MPFASRVWWFTPLLFRNASACSPGAVVAVRAGAEEEGRVAQALVRRGETHTLRYCHDGCIHPGEVEEKKSGKTGDGEGSLHAYVWIKMQ